MLAIFLICLELLQLGGGRHLPGHVRDKRGAATACRYSNTAWGDCDPLLLMRTKRVSLVRDSRYSHEDCLQTREFSQTCDHHDLTSGRNISKATATWRLYQGTRQLLEESRTLNIFREKYRMKMKKFNTFFDDLKSGLMGILTSYHKADSL